MKTLFEDAGGRYFMRFLGSTGTLYTAKFGALYLPKAHFYLLATPALKFPDNRMKTIPDHRKFSHEPSLAPSALLTNELARAGESGLLYGWGGFIEEDWFATEYQRKFYAEAAMEPMRSSINDIRELLLTRNTVCVLCTCEGEDFCHRRLIRELFAHEGFPAVGWDDYPVPQE